MPPSDWKKRWMTAFAVTIGTTTLNGVVNDADAIEPVIVTAIPLDDPEEVEASPSDDTPVAEPVVSPEAMAPVPAAVPCTCCNSTCCTKKKQEAATAAMKGAYKGLFFDNNFSYLNDPCYNGPSFCGDAFKGLCCNRLDLGGEARVRFHNEENIRGLGLTGRDDNFWLTRVRLFANYRMNEYFRFYGEYLYADSGGETFDNRPIEENRGELQNGFVDARLTESLTFRFGRQEELYGAQRLVSPLDWANTRRTFDGAKLLYKGDTWNVDGFFLHPVNRNADTEDKLDDTNEAVDFYGFYATRGDLAIGTLDAYYLGLNNSIADFDYHTIGSRVSGSTDGGQLYEFEGGYQFGKNSPGYGDHSAGFFTAGLGRQLSLCCDQWKPTIWFWYDWASGGDDIPAARGDNGFDHLFPLAHKYLGFMDLYGRRNINDANVQFITPVMGSKVKLLVWYHYFFLDQKTTPYSVVMTPFNPDNRAGDRELGHEIDVLFNISLNPRNSMLVGYSFFDAGRYYSTTPGVPTDADGQFLYVQYQTRF